ncbi:MAG: type 1 glutamine amidotransferase, partial [Proteobacteria bacterium]|nr:type 1 glutamine amidotransferase [Pseudomonadota bacterium]
QTGHAPDELRAEHGDYNEMFMRLLARPDIAFETFPVLADRFPADPSAADAWVVTGSRCGVYDGFPWIARLEGFLRDLHDARAPLVGICFGHQAIAEALGGKVEKFSGGWSVGLEHYRVEGREAPAALLAWHQDQVVVPPPGAEIIAASDFCPYAGLRVGNHILTLQPHPEFSTDYVRALVTARRAMIGEAVAASAIGSLSAGRPDDFGAYILDFIDAAIAAGAP